MSEYHEPVEELDDSIRDDHRALVSLMEEVEAVDWYQQRLARCKDAELARVLEHNRNEEMEHAAMLIEWLRRKKPEWSQRLDKVLYTERPLGAGMDTGAKGTGKSDVKETSGRGLGVGSLQPKRGV